MPIARPRARKIRAHWQRILPRASQEACAQCSGLDDIRSKVNPLSRTTVPERSSELTELVEHDEQSDHSGAQLSDCLTC